MTGRKLIVNADDFGFTVGVNDGILRAFQNGIVTSCSLMATGECFAHAVSLARQHPGLAVGCHLMLVGAKPAADASRVGSLLGRGGLFPRTLREVLLKLFLGTVKQEQIELEFRSQVHALASAGIEPTHLDTHKHLHAHPRIFEALVKVAGEFGISRVRNPFERFHRGNPGGTEASRRPWEFRTRQAGAVAMGIGKSSFRRRLNSSRMRAPDFCCGVSLTGLLDSEAIRDVVRRLDAGVTELVCHPGLYDEQLESAGTRLKRQRQVELESLTDPQVRRAIDENQVQLISYREV